MQDFLAQNASLVVAATFVLYALSIYKLVDVVKHLTEDIDSLKKFRVGMAGTIGGITGPFVYPFLFEVSGIDLTVPLVFSIILGVGTGAVAVNIHNYVEQILTKE